MRALIFTGPTLAPELGAEILADAIFFPPVAQGDVYRAAQHRPWAIGIIDGYFERLPAVWHKEILWAMSQGVHVFGSASMGALRAAELAPFGMVGVGDIYEQYRSGALTDDDEVAVVHGPGEDGYRPLSEAMVNIRATLGAALAQGVVSAASAGALIALAKNTYYAQRGFAHLLRQATEHGVSATEISALQAWLPGGRVDRKQLDACAMLRAMAETRHGQPGVKQVDYHFAYTDVWDQVSRRTGRGALALHPGYRPPEAQADEAAGRGQSEAGARAGASAGDASRVAVQTQIVLDELRLRGQVDYTGVVMGALARALAMEEARRQGVVVENDMLAEVVQQVRREKGLLSTDDARRWLESQVLGLDGFTQLIQREARLRWVQTMFGPEIERFLPDHLRMADRYGDIGERARDKQRVLAAHGLESPGLDDLEISAEELLAWYFDELGQPVPAHLDGYAHTLGLEGADDLFLIIAREYLYRQLATDQ